VPYINAVDRKEQLINATIAVLQKSGLELVTTRSGVLLRDLNPTGDRRVEILEEKYYRLAQDLIDSIADAVGHEPAIPRPQLARMTMAAIDGVVLQFAASNDIQTACSDLAQFGLVLADTSERRHRHPQVRR